MDIRKWGFLGRLAYNIALSADQFLNVILLGDPDESISGRTGRAVESGNPRYRWIRPLGAGIDFVFLHLFGEKDHIKNAIEPCEDLNKELWSWIRK